MRYQFIVLLILWSLLLFSGSAFSLSLDDDEEDKEDVIDYLFEAKKAADNKALDKAQDLLKKASNIGVLNKEVDESKAFISKKEQSLAYIQQARLNADKQQFTKAKQTLKKAQALALFQEDIKKASAYIAKKQKAYRAELARDRAARAPARTARTANGVKSISSRERDGNSYSYFIQCYPSGYGKVVGLPDPNQINNQGTISYCANNINGKGTKCWGWVSLDKTWSIRNAAEFMCK